MPNTLRGVKTKKLTVIRTDHAYHKAFTWGYCFFRFFYTNDYFKQYFV